MNVSIFGGLRTTITNQDYMHKDTKLYRTVILPVVSCGCKTWSVISKEEQWLKVFDEMLMIKLFGPERRELMCKWRKLCTEIIMFVLFAKYYSGVQIKKKEMGGEKESIQDLVEISETEI